MDRKEKIKVIHEHVMDSKHIKPIFGAIDSIIDNKFALYNKKQFGGLQTDLKRSIKLEIIDYLYQIGFAEKTRVDEVINTFTKKHKKI
jgi:hypothetical protein